MDKNLEEAAAELDHDLSADWLDLCNSLRRATSELEAKALTTALALDAAEVSRKADLLCGHVERIHADVQDLLIRIDERLPAGLPDYTTPADRPNSDEIQEEAIKIQREAHEMRADFKDVLKALFMWRDDPAARVKEHHE
jgi:hypothetical protein